MGMIEEVKFRGMSIGEYLVWRLSRYTKYPNGYSACTFCGGAKDHRITCRFYEEV